MYHCCLIILWERIFGTEVSFVASNCFFLRVALRILEFPIIFEALVMLNFKIDEEFNNIHGRLNLLE